MLKVFESFPAGFNTMNSPSPSGFANLRTGYQVNAGGLVLGDCVDFDDQGAGQLTGGVCFRGRYRVVQVDAGATAANVAKGKACYVVPGTAVLGALILTAGSGQTPGAYQVAGTGGGGTGAIISVVVAAGGTVTAIPSVVAAGSGYTSAPTFTLVSGGTPATFQAQMSEYGDIVTSLDVSGVNLSQGRGVFLNSITPGNFGIIQEQGIATILQAATVTSSTVGAILTPVASSDGTFQATVASSAPLATAFGTAIDKPIASTLIRALLTLPQWNG